MCKDLHDHDHTFLSHKGVLNELPVSKYHSDYRKRASWRSELEDTPEIWSCCREIHSRGIFTICLAIALLGSYSLFSHTTWLDTGEVEALPASAEPPSEGARWTTPFPYSLSSTTQCFPGCSPGLKESEATAFSHPHSDLNLFNIHFIKGWKRVKTSCLQTRRSKQHYAYPAPEPGRH